MNEIYFDIIENYDNLCLYLIDFYGVDAKILNYAFTIEGTNEKTLNNICWYIGAYRDIYQLVECEDQSKIYKDYNLKFFEND